MSSVFDIIPNNFFNPLSSNSNYRANAALLQFIYEQYDNEISYRIKRNILRDEVAYFISEHPESFLADKDISNKSYQDISSDYLRRFASKEVGWLEEEFDETTFEKYIVITEPGAVERRSVCRSVEECIQKCQSIVKISEENVYLHPQND